MEFTMEELVTLAQSLELRSAIQKQHLNNWTDDALKEVKATEDLRRRVQSELNCSRRLDARK